MARPPRAEEASTRHVGFRLTDAEIEHLDQLVTKLGFSDRSALLRAWIEHDGPTKRTALRAWKKQGGASSTTTVSASRTSTHAKTVSPVEIPPRTNHRQTPRREPISTHITTTSRTMDSSSSHDESSQATQPKSIMRALLTELHRHKGALLIRVPDVVRAMLAHAPLDAVHDALLTLNRNGLIELRPDGGTEFLKAEDAAVCPSGPRGTVFSYARFKDDSPR